MTANPGFVPPTTEAGALGVHSLDQFVLAVPTLMRAGVLRQFRPRHRARRQHPGDHDLRS